MKIRLAAASAAVAFTAGLIAQIWNFQLGLVLMMIGLLGALITILIHQQAINRRLMKHERFLTQLQNSVASTKAETTRYGNSIFRRIRALTGEAPPGPTNPAPVTPDQSPMITDKLNVGRVATPEVKNPQAKETILSMLDPERQIAIAGIMEKRMFSECQFTAWYPGNVEESIKTSRPELIILDERAIFSSAAWSKSMAGAGAALMKELLRGITLAQAQQIPVYLLQDPTLKVDIYSAALRKANVVALPLRAPTLEAAFGAAQTGTVQRLQQIAIDREGAIS